ncbi:hypothetical protein [Flavobacterium ginsenosidimutans]|uniref:hypothetical protein n=1 Tax=Flavobacterium ginsenosidimutans TaxID=687844 RepID=UPI003D97BBC0
MSTNHNRIRVADLEKNQPNKILKTNQNGELEFTDANNLQAESYNALDCITEGKTLDARQGKVLKDMIDLKPVDLASDTETQISAAVPEDKKVVSRLKLFNWWEWMKRKSEIIVGNWTFNNILKIGNSGYLMTDTYKFCIRGNQGKTLQICVEGVADDSISIDVTGISLKNRLTLPIGTSTIPALVIPNGVLTSSPQKGAIERDLTGELYHVINNARYRIFDSRDSGNFLTTTWRSTYTSSASVSGTYVNTSASSISSIASGALGSSNQGNYLFKTFDNYLIKNGNYSPSLIAPKSVLFEVYLKGNNCKFSGSQYIKLYSVERTDVTTENSIRNYEIPIQTNLSQSGDLLGSVLMFSETTYDTYGNKILENYKKYFLQTIDYVGNYTDLKFSDASISLEYRVSVLFDDSTNQNSKNVYARPIFTNYSSLFLKI